MEMMTMTTMMRSIRTVLWSLLPFFGVLMPKGEKKEFYLSMCRISKVCNIVSCLFIYLCAMVWCYVHV
jgi:uncharacterized membrane protein YqaE (UPF0057 family)